MPGYLDFLYEDPEDEYSNPKRFASMLGLIEDQSSSPVQQSNYLDDSFGTFTRNLPIEQPSGSIVSGGREDLYHKYSQMLEQEPRSESILDDYLGRRPTLEQYKPNLGRKILAGIAGLSAGLGGGDRGGNFSRAYAATNTILKDPYNEAMRAYSDEGKFVDDSMRLADAGRNRQIQGILAQIKQQEVDRANRSRESGIQALRGIQQQGAETARQKALAAEEDKKYQRGFDERKFGETQRRNRALESLAGRRLDERGARTPDIGNTPSSSIIDRTLRDKVNTDPAYREIFRSPLDASGDPKLSATPIPIWVVEQREPTPQELSKYHVLMMKLEMGNLPSVDLLGFGE